MSRAAERQAVWARLLSLWGSTTPIARDAVNGPVYERIEGVAFIRPHFEDGEPGEEFVGVGSATTNRLRAYGTLVVEVFLPIGTGLATGDGYCQTLIDGFTRYTSGAVRFMRRPWAHEVGEDGKFYKWIVFAPYYREESA